MRAVSTERSGLKAARWAAYVLSTFLVCGAATVPAQDTSSEGSELDDAEFYEPPVVRDAASEVLDGPEFRGLPRLDLGTDAMAAKPLKPKKEEAESEEVRVNTPSAGSDLLVGLFGSAITLVVAVVLAAVLAAIVALIVLGMRRWEREERDRAENETDVAIDEEVESAITPGERPADEWLAAARDAASAGRFDEALALLLLGAMSHVERSGLIRPRRGLTYRDYLRAIPRSSAWHPTLTSLVNAYAPVGFGRRDATAAAFDTAVIPYERALALEPTPQAVPAYSE